MRLSEPPPSTKTMNFYTYSLDLDNSEFIHFKMKKCRFNSHKIDQTWPNLTFEQHGRWMTLGAHKKYLSNYRKHPLMPWPSPPPLAVSGHSDFMYCIIQYIKSLVLCINTSICIKFKKKVVSRYHLFSATQRTYSRTWICSCTLKFCG